MTDASSASTGLAEQKRARAEKAVSEIVEKLGAAAKLECKDAPDGSLSIAVSVEGEVPGLAPGKRSPVLEALQFLVNKLVNKPGEERRHVALGIGGHPEPRGPKPGARPAAAPAPGAPPAQAPDGSQRRLLAAAPRGGSLRRVRVGELRRRRLVPPRRRLARPAPRRTTSARSRSRRTRRWRRPPVSSPRSRPAMAGTTRSPR